MVLYNSPFAVAALAVGLVLASVGIGLLARDLLRALRSSRAEHDPERPRDKMGLSPVLREVLRTQILDMVLTVAGIILLVGALIFAISRDLTL